MVLLKLPWMDAYRWFLLTLVGGLVMGFYVELWPDLKMVLTDWQELQNLSLVLSEKEKALSQVGQLSSKLNRLREVKESKPWLTRVIELLNLNLCQLQMLAVKPQREEVKGLKAESNVLQLKLQFQSEFSHLLQLMEALEREGLPLAIERILLQRETESLVSTIEAKVFPLAPLFLESPEQRSFPVNKAPLKRDPFQEAELQLSETVLSEQQLKTLQLKDLRYLGYVRRGERMEALILLPNGEQHWLQKGCHLGKESWELNELSPLCLSFLSRDKKHYQLVKKE